MPKIMLTIQENTGYFFNWFKKKKTKKEEKDDEDISPEEEERRYQIAKNGWNKVKRVIFAYRMS